MPVNSPCAPAAGCSVMVSMPVISIRQRLQQAHDLERALRERFRLVRMRFGDAFEAGDEFVDARVVLHGAAAQRIHAEIDGVVPGGEAREVADDLDLAQLGHQAQVARVRLRPAELSGSTSGTSSGGIL